MFAMSKRSFKAKVSIICTALALSSCGYEQKIRARIWTGGVHEITRDVVIDGLPKTEFLPTDAASFKDFRCLHKDDAEEIVRLALRYCAAP